MEKCTGIVEKRSYVLLEIIQRLRPLSPAPSPSLGIDGWLEWEPGTFKDLLVFGSVLVFGRWRTVSSDANPGIYCAGNVMCSIFRIRFAVYVG